MSQHIVVDGDRLQIAPAFVTRTVTGPATISGSGQATIGNKKICIEGDEQKVRLAATYTIPGGSAPGQGTVTITALHPGQLVPWCRSGQPVIVVGQKFTASFIPSSPAIGPPPGNTPDPLTPTPGNGTFNHSQSFVRAG